MPRIVVVGAGVSGLTLALRLEQLLPAAEVTILERQARPGGMIQTVARDGFVVEAGPNGFPDNNPSTLDLARGVGLQDRLVAASESAGRNRFLFLRGKLRQLPASMGAFLRSDLLSWPGKLELLAEGVRPRRGRFGDESIDSFARRRAGREVASTLADAFVTGVMAGDPRLLSVQASFPRLAGYERDLGSVTAGMKHAARQRRQREADLRGETLPPPPGLLGRVAALFRPRPQPARAGSTWSFDGGLATLTAALAGSLRQQPVLGAAVRRVRKGPRGFVVEGEGHDRWEADAVALTCPAGEQAAALAELDPALAERVGGIAYNSVVVVALGYRRAQSPHPLDGFGYLSPQREGRPVLGVQWCSSIFPGRAPDGMVLLRALCGGWRRRDVVGWPEERLLRAVREELAVALGVRTPPVFHHVVRWPRAIPQYFVGHLERLAWVERRLADHPGLFLGGNPYRGVALNDCVEQSRLLAARLAAWLPKD
jgi:oxygen-dependent protoporphyrinogen oxidase